ncbi:uncharacterized protein E0L32_010519 [Thyridium curvatum]|uniref:WSC domain-containing protein n=1 Tax=Thyridium curvatum TaxID=1093900 RepID=A0A507AGC5_9PEZI|nr:uncharacterized protein E0L32_010519 [Thyridium curvatum]TPX07832.1 hypothetical protein E0L32_010519 [Thyridium curvatum]
MRSAGAWLSLLASGHTVLATLCPFPNQIYDPVIGCICAPPFVGPPGLPCSLCPGGTDYFNGLCVPSCGTNEMHDPNSGVGACICITNYALYNGTCVSPCPPGTEDVSGTCMAVCLTNEIRNPINFLCDCPPPYTNNGTTCDCPTGQELFNATCTNVCPTNTVRQPSGGCSCNSPFLVDQGNCVAACGGARVPVNTVCLDPCGANMMRATNNITCVCQPTFVPDIVPGTCVCPSGQQQFNGTCLPACGPNEMRNSTSGSCECPGTFFVVLGTNDCVQTCPAGTDAVQTFCVPPCAPLQIRDSNGICQCGPDSEDDGNGGCKCVTGFQLSSSTTCVAVPTTTPASNSTSSTASPSSSTSSVSTSSGSTTSLLPTVVTPSSTSSSSTSSSSSSPSSTSTSGPMPPQVGDFSVVGCTGSDQSFPSFRLQTSSVNMTLEMCTAACSNFLYAGVHIGNCYCANTFDNVVTVQRGLCNIPCPGNPDESCGGSRQAASRLARRQTGLVPADALLAVYINDPIASTATLPVPATTSSSSSTLPPAASTTAAAAQTTGVTTSTATAVATATSTAYPCAGGYCNQAGWFFELCQGFPNPGEVVFVMEACTCAGGWQFVVAGCDGASCGSLAVYRAVPCQAGVVYTNVTVYQPQACATCAGGVTFVQGSGSSSSGSGSGSGSASSTTSVVVVAAGANRIASFVSTLMVAVGAFALLI